jgi:hypothetical protein
MIFLIGTALRVHPDKSEVKSDKSDSIKNLKTGEEKRSITLEYIGLQQTEAVRGVE